MTRGARRRRWTAGVLGAAVAAALAPAGRAPAGRAPRALAVAPCPAEPEALCGSIPVLWDASRPALGRMRIAFKLYPRTDGSRPRLGTFVALNGGPGGASTRPGAFPVAGIFAALRSRRDLLLVDQRGTGRSGAIDCPALQAAPTAVYPRRGARRAVRACVRRLGRRVNLYGSGAAANDLDAVRAALGIGRIDLYGVSYGTFLAQAYAVRHGKRLRSLTLDSAYPARGMDIWERDNARAIRAGLRRVCTRDASCRRARRDPLADVRRADELLRRRPVSGVVTAAGGRRVRVRVDAAGLAGMAYDAGGLGEPQLYQQLDAASRALRAGDATPLLRLSAGSRPSASPAEDWSNGLYAAVTCHDYPVPYDRAAAPRVRRTQLAQARARLRRDSFAPFTVADWLSAPIEPANYPSCTEWPAPARRDPPIPSGARYPQAPTLVLGGDLDTSTALPTARALARRFPHGRFVAFRNATHALLVTGCAQQLIARFVSTLGPGDTSCARRLPPVHPVESFPRPR